MEPSCKDIMVLFITLVQFVGLALSACPSPDVPENVYSLIPLHGMFSTGAIVDVVCAPPYKPEMVFQLTCDTSGTWLGHWPDCSLRESKAKWWMLMIGLVSVVVIIPCILPRLYYTYIDPSSPLAKAGGKSRMQMEDFSKGEEGSEMRSVPSQPTEVHMGPPLYPKPLPPIRQKQQ